MDTQAVAQHWANRIVVEFGEYQDMVAYAEMLKSGRAEDVYEENKYLITKSITNVPGHPIKLYFLKELALALHQIYAKEYS